MFGGTDSQSYNFDSSAIKPDREHSVEGDHLSEIIQNPEILFSDEGLNEKDRYKNHRKNREYLTDKSKFLGMGNDGLVVSMDDPQYGKTCIKFVWETLEVYPGKDFTFGDLDDEIFTLHIIADKFKEIREITRDALRDMNRVSSGKNNPIREAAFQDSSRKILLSEGHNCYIPEVLEVQSFRETEDESEDDPEPLYYLDEKYTTITMDLVRGKSIQDIILGYPETKEYIDAINIDQLEKDIQRAFKSLHEHKIRHQDVTIRNIMFDLEQKRPVLIDFGKASYGSGDITVEEEMEHVAEVFNHLRAFLINPEQKQAQLIEEFRKRATKLNI